MNDADRRSEPRITIDEFYSMQFFLEKLHCTCQFKLWDISTHGLCIILKNDSEILPALTVGDVLKVKYHPINLYDETKISETQIRHISPGGEHRFKDHTLVGLKIIDSPEPQASETK